MKLIENYSNAKLAIANGIISLFAVLIFWFIGYEFVGILAKILIPFLKALTEPGFMRLATSTFLALGTGLTLFISLQRLQRGK